MSTLIVPLCGKSERFGLNFPKWILPVENISKTPNISSEILPEVSMLVQATGGIPFQKLHMIYRAQDEVYIEEIGENYLYFSETKLNYQTATQVETIRAGLIRYKITGPIQIKDCDNYFKSACPDINFISYSPLQGVVFNPEAKSYIQLNEHEEIVNVVEKKIVSDKFCCGLYGFEDSAEFLYYSKGCAYISEVIFKMLLNKKIFKGIPASDYVDWGTIESYTYNHVGNVIRKIR
jgi:hypothetical protein